MSLDDDGDRDEQPFDELMTISDKSALIPHEEPAIQSWEELKTVSWLTLVRDAHDIVVSNTMTL